MFHLPLNHHHQLGVLRDILIEHLSELNGTASEYEQLERLVESLLNNDQVSSEMKQQLKEISQYSQTGQQSSDPSTYISEHQQELTQLVDEIDHFA